MWIQTLPNEPKRNHYVPQFYMRQFAYDADRNKVRVVERHRDAIVAESKSIDRIGFERGLHDFVENGVAGSIESKLNKMIETPFSGSRTWAKIESGNFAALDALDGLPIYGFALHLQRRNLATHRFLEQEHARFLGSALRDVTREEQEMHHWIAETTAGAHRLFLEGALDMSIPEDAHAINVIVCQAPIPFRSSTNPILMVSHPGRESMFGAIFNSLRTWWLTLDRYWGAFIIAGGPPGFSSQAVEHDVAHVINRLYLVQMLQGEARYMLADDARLECDLAWAGFVLEHRKTHSARYRADSNL